MKTCRNLVEILWQLYNIEDHRGSITQDYNITEYCIYGKLPWKVYFFWYKGKNSNMYSHSELSCIIPSYFMTLSSNLSEWNIWKVMIVQPLYKLLSQFLHDFNK